MDVQGQRVVPDRLARRPHVGPLLRGPKQAPLGDEPNPPQAIASVTPASDMGKDAMNFKCPICADFPDFDLAYSEYSDFYYIVENHVRYYCDG